MTSLPWLVVLAIVAAAMLCVPFVPAWNEWRRPVDAQPLAVPPEYSSRIDYFARQARQWAAAGGEVEHLRFVEPRRFDEPLAVHGDFVASGGASVTALLALGDVHLGPHSEVTQWAHADRDLTLGADSVALRRVSCGRAMELAVGVSFERLHAPTITFGAPRGVRARASPPAVAFTSLASVTRVSEDLFRVRGDLALPADSRFEGSLIVTGGLSVGENTVIAGNVKAHKGIIVAPGCSIHGSLVCERGIHLHEGAFVKGPVVSETDIWLAPGVTLGTVESPTTVTAENIMVGTGVKAHGTVWARDAGVVWA
jgi:cytoskeletal protein CcmA (bactofilin family)